MNVILVCGVQSKQISVGNAFGSASLGCAIILPIFTFLLIKTINFVRSKRPNQVKKVIKNQVKTSKAHKRRVREANKRLFEVVEGLVDETVANKEELLAYRGIIGKLIANTTTPMTPQELSAILEHLKEPIVKKEDYLIQEMNRFRVAFNKSTGQQSRPYRKRSPRYMELHSREVPVSDELDFDGIEAAFQMQRRPPAKKKAAAGKKKTISRNQKEVDCVVMPTNPAVSWLNVW